MTIQEAIFVLNCVEAHGVCIKAKSMAIKSLEAWEKIDDDIASLQDIYSIGKQTETEKAIWKNLQAVRKSIHEYLREVTE